MEIQKILIIDNNFYIRRPIPNTIYIVEGGIAAGKSYAMRENFPDDMFVKVYEPIRRMKDIITRQYNHEITSEEATIEIEKLCSKCFYTGLKQAITEKKGLVVERCPWYRKYIFKYPIDVSRDDIKRCKKELILHGRANNEILGDIISKLDGESYEEKIRNEYDRIANFKFSVNSSYFNKISILFIELPEGEMINRFKKRGRQCEKDLPKEYLELIRHKTYQFTKEWKLTYEDYKELSVIEMIDALD